MPSTYAHFIGIGGVGMSGIALVLHEKGYKVSGSDLKESRYTKKLRDAGVDVFIGHDAANLGEPQVVVVSSAISEANPEYAAALERKLDIWPRAKMLAHLAGEQKTIAVAGTHGKTSTSSMIATMLDRMGENPTFLVGGTVEGFGSNAACGEGDHYVVEADESDGSFTYLDPYVAMVTNIEADHLDHYASLDEIERTFETFMRSAHPDGCLVVCADDARLVEIARDLDRRMVTYGFSDDADVRLEVTGREGLGMTFRVTTPDGLTVDSRSTLPGAHMALNSAGALAIAWALGLDLEAAALGLAHFGGVRRRFDLIDEVGGVTIVDDYAHHPTEVAATLAGASQLGYGRVWAIFQPHRYSRTEALAAEFGGAFADADGVVLMDVYSAGEAPIPGVSGKTVVNAILGDAPRSRVAYLPHRTDVLPYIVSVVRPGDLVMTMGAGDVTAIGPEIARELRDREGARA